MRHLAFLATLTLVPSATAQLQFASTAGSYVRLLGGKFFVGSQQTSSTALGLSSQTTSRSQLTVSPSTMSLGGHGNDIPTDARLDPSGNIWIVGNTDSDDFPLVNPIVSHKVGYRTAGFVVELDPTASHLLFSTYLAGQTSSRLPYASHARALTIDSSGNVYVGGDTDEPDFPTTVPHTSGGGADDFGANFVYSFVAKISPAGKLVYSTLLNTGLPQCSVGSGCIGRDSTFGNVSTLTVDSTGAITAAGTMGGAEYGLGYVSRLSADGAKLLWTASVGASFGAVDTFYFATDPAGHLNLFGRYAQLVGLFPYLELGARGLFSAQLSADGSTLSNVTDFGLSPDSRAAGISIDSSGRVYLAGASSSAKFPNAPTVPNLGAEFIFSPSPTPILFRFPTGVVTAPPTFDATGNLQILGAQGAFLTLSPTYNFTTPVIVGFANSASYAMNTGLFRETLISFFGYGLPPNVHVIMDGDAQILYSGPTQINVQVPPSFNLYGSTINIVLPSQTISFTPPAIQSVGLFTTDGTYAAALNQDGTANSAANPTPLNSIVSLFGTGASGGTVATAYINTVPQNVLYFGPAPGLIGVFQANVMVTATGSITLQTPGFFPGELTTNSVRIYTK